jgi:hypothetical protein
MKKDDLPEKVEAEVEKIREKIMSLEEIVIAEGEVIGCLSLTKNLESHTGRMIEVATLLKDMIIIDLIIGHLITDTVVIVGPIRGEILQLILKDMKDHQVVIEMPLTAEIVKIEKVAIEGEEVIEEVAAIQVVDIEEVMTDLTEEEEVETEVVSEVEVEEEIIDLEVEVILEDEGHTEEICMILIWVRVKSTLLMQTKPNRQP